MNSTMQRPWGKESLQRAIMDNQFVPYFQPQIDLETGRLIGMELLARWEHPELGLLPPSHFIETMEREGLIDQLTERLLCRALDCVRENTESGLQISMAFNVSPLSLVNIQMPRKICSLVRAYGIPFDMITIEVTETAHADDSPSVLDSLTWLRMQGFKISIDDFGTGYSSLQLLSQMPFTEIKIDRTFVTGMSNHWKSTTILESVVELADKLHMRTVAEGIETKKEYEFIRALGCRNGQGFYLGHPMRNSELIAWVKRDLSLASPSALSMRGASETELPMSMACA